MFRSVTECVLGGEREFQCLAVYGHTRDFISGLGQEHRCGGVVLVLRDGGVAVGS